MPATPERERWKVVAALIVGYVGIYLCRKNLSTALPLLQEEFHKSKAELGFIASVSTLTYAIGKVVLGPIIDGTGGRRGFLTVMFLVAALGAAGAFSPSLTALTVLYAANRLFGAGGWPSMMKLVPTWFPPARTGWVTAILSLSYVAGGALASALASGVLAAGGGWRAVMGFPSLVLLVIALGCAVVVRPGSLVQADATRVTTRDPGALIALLLRPQFIIICLLSLTLTLVRETFNTWSVDFLHSIQSGERSVATAALGSTAFDLAGFVSILAMGFAWDRTPPAMRRWLLASLLFLLTLILLVLPDVASVGGAILIGAVGLVVYGPYSLLAGALAVSAGGPRLAATASGVIDAIGYGAGFLSGVALGKLLDIGGYALGFRCLAGVALVSAFLALGLAEDKPA